MCARQRARDEHARARDEVRGTFHANAHARKLPHASKFTCRATRCAPRDVAQAAATREPALLRRQQRAHGGCSAEGWRHRAPSVNKCPPTQGGRYRKMAARKSARYVTEGINANARGCQLSQEKEWAAQYKINKMSTYNEERRARARRYSQ